MKLYVYIIKPDDINDRIISDSLSSLDPYVYAVTTSKSLAKDFEKQRDMNHFIKIKKECTKEEVIYYINNHKSCYLGYSPLNYYKTKDIKSMELISVLLTAEEKEKMVVMGDMNGVGILDTIECNMSDTLYSKEVFDILDKFGFSSLCFTSLVSDDYEKIEMTIDELKLFYYYYRRILKN